MPDIPAEKRVYVHTRAAWRAWLRTHYRTEHDVWLVLPKKHTGKPRLPYDDSVEEALCFGWIDSTVGTIDADTSAQRFSRRRPRSNWSQPNLERIRKLVAEGKVAKDVLPTLPDYDAPYTVPKDILAAIKANRQAWTHYKTFSEPYIRIRTRWIDDARNRPAEFDKRLAYFIRMSEKGKQFGYGGVEKHY